MEGPLLPRGLGFRRLDGPASLGVQHLPALQARSGAGRPAQRPSPVSASTHARSIGNNETSMNIKQKARHRMNFLAE